MARLSLSDVVEAQAAQVETLLGMVRDLTASNAAILASLTEARKPTASEEIVLSRSKLADKATGIDVKIVPQNGESEKDAALRAADVFEALAARYPTPSGAAHASPLGDGLDDWRKTAARGEGLHAVPDPEEAS